MLSAAKNPQAPFQTRQWPPILRCAQHDRAESLFHRLRKNTHPSQNPATAPVSAFNE